MLLNEAKAAEAIDIFAAAKEANRAWQLELPVEVKSDEKEIYIKLLKNSAGPAIKGIEVRGK